MADSPLISAEALQALIQQTPAPVILDCSFDLSDPSAGEKIFQARHLPGARYVHLDRDLSAPQTDAAGNFLGRHPLRSRAEYAALMGLWGITPQTPVVVYDRQAGMYAARLWWTLHWMGHPLAWVLDGGLTAWEHAKLPLAQGTSTPSSPTTPYPDLPPQRSTVQAPQLLNQLDECLVIDARAPERFRGDVEPLDRVAGHLPGARNRFFKDNLQADGRFKPADQLRAEFMALIDGHPSGSIVHQCGSGVTACHNLLAMEHAGFAPTTLYPGSWSEWAALSEAYPKVREAPLADPA